MEVRPATDLSTIEDPEVDLARLQAEVRAAAAVLHSEPGAPAAASRARPAVAGPSRSPVEAGATIRPYADLPIRGLATPLRRLLRRALRWWLWPVTVAMSTHNHAVASVLAENRRQLARLELEHERLRRDLDVLTGGRGSGARRG